MFRRFLLLVFCLTASFGAAQAQTPTSSATPAAIPAPKATADSTPFTGPATTAAPATAMPAPNAAPTNLPPAPDAPLPVALPTAAPNAPGSAIPTFGSGAGRAIFKSMRSRLAQTRQLDLQARLAMLGALTPAHRTLLGQIVGQLAVAPQVQPASGAAALDRVLSSAESAAIVRIDAQYHAQAYAMMQATMGDLEAAMPPAQRQEMDRKLPQLQHGLALAMANADRDPGRILLRTVATSMMQQLMAPTLGHALP